MSIINKTEKFVKERLSNAEGGHDWFHIQRVRTNAIRIAKQEKADLQIVELAALLHDIADSKFHDGDENLGPRLAQEFLETNQLERKKTEHIVEIIKNMSFKSSFTPSAFHSIELDVVRDADRLDAIGAIGIARTFNYGGFKNHAIYDPDIPPNTNMTKEEYKNSNAPTINHFYEKLLLLKDRMKTVEGKRLAEERHRFMEAYLQQFYKEWNEG